MAGQPGFYVYILACENGAYYSGWTTDPARRLKTHNSGKGARYTRMNGPSRLVYLEKLPNRKSAMQREQQLKRMDHARKAALLAWNPVQPVREPEKTEKSSVFVPAERFSVIAPGRVNLLGEHVDYNDGIVLPAAIDREVRLEVTALAEPILKLNALDLGLSAEIPLDKLKAGKDTRGEPMPAFARYPAGVAWALQSIGLETRGLEATYRSTVPIGAGLSSSAAVEVAFALAWKYLGGWNLPDMDFVQLCQAAENHYVGVQSGLMDQFSSYFGVKGCALRFDTRSLDWRPVQLPADTRIVIADTGVRRTLSGSAYNERRADCEEVMRLLRAWHPEITALRDVTPEQLEARAQGLPERVLQRARHVVEEIARVEQAEKCLERGDTRQFGALMAASHASLRDQYEVSCPELDSMVALANRIPGCLGARLTGAGFGGCTVNLVESDKVEMFIEQLARDYHEKVGIAPSIYLCRPAQGAHISM